MSTMSAIQKGIAAVRQGVLANLRLTPQYSLSYAQTYAPISSSFLRFFADASYLDKNDVTERIMNVVKNFEKVDVAKASGMMNKGLPSCKIMFDNDE